jgi:RNA polymerase sigma-70 factor (ECF subfamily)
MRESAGDALEDIYRTHGRAALATLIRLLGDFDLAEEALGEAWQSAVQQWPREGMPSNPWAWLVSAGRFRAIDRLRRRARLEAVWGEIADIVHLSPVEDRTVIEDDRLHLIFICCHPAIPPDRRVALALRTLCGLTTEEIARAFLVPAPTSAQRIVRAKPKIRDEKLPYETRAIAPAFFASPRTSHLPVGR